jgi:hypothetical protein
MLKAEIYNFPSKKLQNCSIYCTVDYSKTKVLRGYNTTRHTLLINYLSIHFTRTCIIPSYHLLYTYS